MTDEGSVPEMRIWFILLINVVHLELIRVKYFQIYVYA